MMDAYSKKNGVEWQQPLLLENAGVLILHSVMSVRVPFQHEKCLTQWAPLIYAIFSR